MNEKEGQAKRAATRASAAISGAAMGSASTAAAARTAAATPIGPRHTPSASGGLLMAGPLSGQYDGTVRIRTPHPHDVLCGRGGSINSHPGNIRFRDWVKVRKQQYNLATSKVAKARMCREVFNLVRALDPPGKFLQRMDDVSGMVGVAGGCWWMEINEQKALAKTSQALREGAPKIREMHKTVDAPAKPKPAERKRSGGSRGTKRKAAVKESPVKRARRGSVTAQTREVKANSVDNAPRHPGEMIQLTPTSSAVALKVASDVARTGLPQLPFYRSFAQPPPLLSGGEGARTDAKPAAVPGTTAPQNTGLIRAPVTPVTDCIEFSPTQAPISPLFLSPIGNGTFPPDMNPPVLNLGDPAHPEFAHLAPAEGRGMKRSHSLENHELEGGGTYEFQDPFKDESHILSGKALRSPKRKQNSEGINSQPTNDGEAHRANNILRSVVEKKVHNIIENDHDISQSGGHLPVQKNWKNCFCLCGTPGNHCICSDLADHLLHRSDGFDELNLISEC